MPLLQWFCWWFTVKASSCMKAGDTWATKYVHLTERLSAPKRSQLDYKKKVVIIINLDTQVVSQAQALKRSTILYKSFRTLPHDAAWCISFTWQILVEVIGWVWGWLRAKSRTKLPLSLGSGEHDINIVLAGSHQDDVSLMATAKRDQRVGPASAQPEWCTGSVSHWCSQQVCPSSPPQLGVAWLQCHILWLVKPWQKIMYSNNIK